MDIGDTKQNTNTFTPPPQKKRDEGKTRVEIYRRETPRQVNQKQKIA